MINLTKRLQAVASLAEPGNTVADIGCDHGYVGIWLIQNGLFSKAVAMDVRPGPLEAAKKNIALCQMDKMIETRLSDGLSALGDKEADCMICAGMGGALVCRILDEGMEKTVSMKQMILQPQSEIPMVRRFLRQKGFVITKEDMVKEDGKYYSMFRAVRGNIISSAGEKAFRGEEKPAGIGTEVVCAGETISGMTLEDEYGRFLLEMRHPVLYEWLLHERELSRTLCLKLEGAMTEKQADAACLRQEKRLHELKAKLCRIEKVLEYYR